MLLGFQFSERDVLVVFSTFLGLNGSYSFISGRELISPIKLLNAGVVQNRIISGQDFETIR